DRRVVHAAELDGIERSQSVPQGRGLRSGAGVEIDVGVPALDRRRIPLRHHPSARTASAAAIASLTARTPAAGPSGWFQTPPAMQRKSAPAVTSGPQLSGVMPPIATEGTVATSFHQASRSGSARRVTSFVPEGKKAPKAT